MTRRTKGFLVAAAILSGLLAGVACYVWTDPMRRAHVVSRTRSTFRRDAGVEARLEEFAGPARDRWRRAAEAAGRAYPPRQVVFAAFKDERRLDVFDVTGAPRRLQSFAILGASGRAGPKLREGDRQVPEGVYACTQLNPNSTCYVSLRVDYPNADDREIAAEEGRTNLGGDIMIHGGSMSVGCLAIGDDAMEDVFTLAADVGIENVKIVIAPCDLRVRAAPAVPDGAPMWTSRRWAEVAAELGLLPVP